MGDRQVHRVPEAIGREPVGDMDVRRQARNILRLQVGPHRRQHLALGLPQPVEDLKHELTVPRRAHGEIDQRLRGRGQLVDDLGDLPRQLGVDRTDHLMPLRHAHPGGQQLPCRGDEVEIGRQSSEHSVGQGDPVISGHLVERARQGKSPAHRVQQSGGGVVEQAFASSTTG